MAHVEGIDVATPTKPPPRPATAGLTLRRCTRTPPARGPPWAKRATLVREQLAEAYDTRCQWEAMTEPTRRLARAADVELSA